MDFHRSIFAELLEADALLVLARGLGVRTLLCRFIRFYASTLPRGASVVVLNASKEYEVMLRMLEADGMAREALPRSLSTDQGAAERRRSLEGGGIVFASSQMLLIDLISGRCDAERIAGILVVDAHRITETSQEGFALRVFKQKHARGFVRAFSDDPETLSSGFNRLSNTMRALHVRRVLLWPRFHEFVRKDLDNLPRLVGGGEELVDLSPRMCDVQRAIMAAMDAAMASIKGATHVDTGDVTRTNALFDNFDEIVRRLLGGSHLALKPSVMGALSDLKALRKVLGFLVRYDAIAFFTFLSIIRAAAVQEEAGGGGGASRRNGEWILTEAGEAVFKAAKERIYAVVPLDEPPLGAGTGASGAQGVGRGGGGMGARGKGGASSQVRGGRGGGGVGRGANERAGALASSSLMLSKGVDALTSEGAVVVAERVVSTAKTGGFGAGGGSGSAPAPQPLSASLAWVPKRRYTLDMPLEHNPKWKRLDAVLTESLAVCATERRQRVGDSGNKSGSGDGTILIVARDDRTCQQLVELLTRGAHGMLEIKFANFLRADAARTANMRDRVRQVYAPLLQPVPPPRHQDAGAGAGAGAMEADEDDDDAPPAPSLPWYAQPSFLSLTSDERDLLLAADLLELPVPPPTTGGPPPTIYIAPEQRLLWKQTARTLYHERQMAVQAHAALADMDAERLRGALHRSMQDLGGGGGGAGARKTDGEVIELFSSPEEFSIALSPHAACFHAHTNAVGRGAPLPRVLIYPLSKADLCPPILPHVRPRVVILYDPDPAFMRELELYAAMPPPGGTPASTNPGEPPLSVVVLTYEHSVEKRVFTTAVTRERESFVKLISEKKTMAPIALPPSLQEVRAVGGTDASLVAGKGPEGPTDAWGIAVKGDAAAGAGGTAGALAALGAAAGGGGGGAAGAAAAGRLLLGGGDATAAAAAAAFAGGSGRTFAHGDLDAPRARIIVDMRDLRSKLPSLLDLSGLLVDPCTLEVGDYILTPTICVERKSVPDLLGSLASGRLYNQAAAMVRSYPTPLLLIEFDADKPFELLLGGSDGAGGGGHFGGGAGGGAATGEVDIRDPRAKLALLLLHFPQLRVAWSRSAHATVSFFKALKLGSPQPDREAAMAMRSDMDTGAQGTGGGEAEGPLAAALRSEGRNVTAIDLLRKLPGITPHNYKALVGGVPSLAALARMPLDAIAALIGTASARTLHTFLHARRGGGALGAGAGTL